jgi:hypothetical protein
MKLIWILLISLPSMAQMRNWDYVDEEKIQSEEKRLYMDESLLSISRDAETGLDIKTYDTNEDKKAIRFSYMANADLRDAANISTFEVAYSIRRGGYWLEAMFARTSATTEDILGYNTNIAQETAELKNETSSINEWGVGLSTRTKYLQLLYDSQRMFETVGATLNYVSLSEPFYEDSYKGVGIKADFGIHFRIGKSYHVGLRYSYHLASIRKAKDTDTQPGFERSLVVDWMGFGADMTFYF